MRIETTAWFDKQIKHLAKKYKSIPADFRHLLESLEDEPTQGTPLGRGAFKIRMPITSKGRGKSGGSRVITCVRVNLDTIFMLDIYDKSDRETISDEDLNSFIDQIDEL
jgi:mRNA-degrading endonuclease RelE of RelBE toxin-antitoxin system